VLTSLFSKGAISLAPSSQSFRKAVSDSVGLLVSAGHAKAEYVDLVIQNLERLGPYFVVAPHIAIAHATGTGAVLSPGLSLLKLEKGVVSGARENDPVHLVFSLCTPNDHDHIELLSKFAKVMSVEGVVNSLLNASAESVIREILEI
jgi:ascorbate PTS system EIIA or EIIAB component